MTDKEKQIEDAWALHLNAQKDANQSQAMVRRHWLERHLKIQNNSCAYCGVTLVIGKLPGFEDRQATIDHVVASSCGGIDDIENTVAACAHCNVKKGHHSLFVFLTGTLLRQRIEEIFDCPDRLSADQASDFFDAKCLADGISIFFEGKELKNIDEYCMSEGWVKIGIPGVKDRQGKRMALIKKGVVIAKNKFLVKKLTELKRTEYVNEFTSWMNGRIFDK